jgi:hypothetical protein
MDKKDALVLMLENSLMVTDAEKKKVLYKLNSLSKEQIDALGTFLAYEQLGMLENKDKLLKQTKLLMNTLELIIKP